MSVITVSIPSAGGYTPRTQVSGNQWTEVNIPSAGAIATPPLIGSKREVLNVLGWTPAAADEEVPHGHSVLANIEATNSVLLDIRRDEGADWNPGTFSDVEIVGTELNLVTSPYIEDWEEGVPAEDNWTSRFSMGEYGNVQDDGSGSNMIYRGINWNDPTLYTANDGPFASAIIIKDRFLIKNKWDAKIGLAARITGSGTACRGYVLLYVEDTNTLSLRRITGDGTFYQEGWNNTLPISEAQVEEWVWMAYRVTVGGGHYFKIWKEPDTEPASWTWIATHNGHPGPGDCGMIVDHSTGNEYVWRDDFSAETIPPEYQTSGYWEGEDDINSVDHYSHGLVTWIEDIPTDTTLAVKVRWPGGTWQTCTNGEILPDIEYEQDMRAGSTKELLEWRIEFTTTNTDVTPTIEDLRVYFEPGRQEEMEIVVDGESCVPDDGSLVVWGRALIGTSGNPPTLELDWSDLWAMTAHPWLVRDLETITATFKYWGNVIEAITFEAEGSKFRHGHPEAYYTFPLLPYYSGPVIAEWTALKEWYPQGKIYEWTLTDRGLAIHADAKWIVGHARIDDHPLSFLISVPNIHDHPLSVQVRGWRRDDHQLSMLVQGWRRDDWPLSFTVGVWQVNDHPVSLLTAIEYLNDHPLSMLVYGVSREGMIEVNIIDTDTWAELLALGYTRS